MMRNTMQTMNHGGIKPAWVGPLLAALCCLAGVGAEAAQFCNPNIAPTRPDSRYELVTGATPAGSEVRDKVTRLVWQRCVQGMQWNGSACTGTATAHSWTAALDLARTATATTASPATPWRVPNRAELLSLPERACHSPAINTTWFPAEPGGQAWSSSPLSDSPPSNAWSVNFTYGDDSYDGKVVTGGVRLVRSGQ